MTELGRYLLRRLWVDEPGRQVAEAQAHAGEIVYVHLFSANASFAKALFSISRTLQNDVPGTVVRIHDYGFVDGRPFVAVLPGQGVPLSSALFDGNTPSEDDAIEVVLHAARGLKALWEVSHHGALDPGAIVVYPNGEVRIDGVGRTLLAERYGLLGKSSIDGLRAYRPENATSASGRDIAALAAVLHELLAKHPPEKSPSGRFKVSAEISGRVARTLEATFDRPDETALDDFISQLEEVGRRAGAEDLWDFAALISDWSESSAGRTQMAYPTTAVLSSSFAEDETLETVSFATSTFDAKTDGDDPLIGQSLEGYEILRHIDSGAFADIYLARNRTTGQTAAIKILHDGLAAVESIKRRLEREAQALISIRHPNVARAFQLGHSSAGAPLVVLEYLEGKTLLDVIDEEAPMATERIIELATQIASGLEAIHKAGVVHRDLKPSNIMVIPSPKGDRLKILDFGVSRWLHSDQQTRLTQARELVGSPGYMAPEQIASASEAGPAADLYALGVTIYLMRNRVPPFSGDRDELLFKHANAPAPRLMDTDPLCPLVDRLLAKTPEQRFGSASAVCAALSQLRDETTRKVAPRPTRSPAKKRDRLPVYAAILIASLAGLGFAGGWLSRAQRSSEPPRATALVEVKAVAGAPKVDEKPDPELPEISSQVDDHRPSPPTRSHTRRKKVPKEVAVEEQSAAPRPDEIPAINEVSIDAKLSRILKKLRDNVGANRDAVAELERRYFSLRATLEAGPKGARALRSLDERATKLEDDLDQLSP